MNEWTDAISFHPQNVLDWLQCKNCMAFVQIKLNIYIFFKKNKYWKLRSDVTNIKSSTLYTGSQRSLWINSQSRKAGLSSRQIMCFIHFPFIVSYWIPGFLPTKCTVFSFICKSFQAVQQQFKVRMHCGLAMEWQKVDVMKRLKPGLPCSWGALSFSWTSHAASWARVRRKRVRVRWLQWSF